MCGTSTADSEKLHNTVGLTGYVESGTDTDSKQNMDNLLTLNGVENGKSKGYGIRADEYE